ncbi:hypothetical protein CLOM_g10210 [Closterium sp. NIES-68]|nr:hypothetical protein CLOM_g10210 [Closterium sp. NIES-68]
MREEEMLMEEELYLRRQLGKKVLWSLEEETSCIKDLWQLPIIPWNGKTPTAATVAAAKATAGGDATAPTDGVLEAVKKEQQQQTHGEKLVKDGSLKGLEVKGGVKEIGSCPTCLETKFSKFPFNSATGPAKTPLALVHMDVVGPTRAPSLSGSHYFLTIVDDHTRAVWVYHLKSKGEVAAAVLKEWMPRAQRECGHKVKVIRSDNGGEFIGADFEGVVSRPSHEQLEAAKRLVRYVSATASVGLEYSGVRQRLQRGAADVKSGEILLSCYTDASFNSVKADGTSIGGYVCLLGGGAVSWRSKKQNEMGLSSCICDDRS